MALFISVLEQGMIYAIMALGVYITYKILDFPDLTVDGSFPLGAAVTASLIQAGVNPYLSLLAALLAGTLAGICTGLIHVKCKVRDLLSGIIMMTGLYTVNLVIAGKANVPIFNQDSIFDNAMLDKLPRAIMPYRTLFVVLLITLVVKAVLDAYMQTKSGLLLRAVGDNEVLVTALAKDKGTVKIIGLAIANALAALSGAVMCQQQRFFEVSMGTGTMVIGLASVIIGTSLFKNLPKMKTTTAVIIGSVVYKACVAIALKMHLDTNYLKLITAVLFLIILVLSRDKRKKVKCHA